MIIWVQMKHIFEHIYMHINPTVFEHIFDKSTIE